MMATALCCTPARWINDRGSCSLLQRFPTHPMECRTKRSGRLRGYPAFRAADVFRGMQAKADKPVTMAAIVSSSTAWLASAPSRTPNSSGYMGDNPCQLG